jgi:UDP-3-O-[3-hydroxymyristoyl] glucosamine N-acyltransferase
MDSLVKLSAICDFLGIDFSGEDFSVTGISTASEIKEHTLIFTKDKNFDFLKKSKIIVICPKGSNMANGACNFLEVNNPRLVFAKVVNKFFVKKIKPQIEKTTIIGQEVIIGNNVYIGNNVVIGDNVKINQGTIINANVVIASNVTIGKDCYIKSGAIIGEDGFGFDFEEDGTPVKFPQMGGVIIGDRVEIGAKCTIARGTIDDTVVLDDVKIDDQVHIAHNCFIGSKTIITACSELSGGVKIGDSCWLGPNSSIIQKVSLGNNVKVGIGTAVNESIDDNSTVMGLPGVGLRKLIKLRRLL